jgi:hypothetical protein
LALRTVVQLCSNRKLVPRLTIGRPPVTVCGNKAILGTGEIKVKQRVRLATFDRTL